MKTKTKKITQARVDIIIHQICKMKALNQLNKIDTIFIKDFLDDTIEYHDFVTHLDRKVNKKEVLKW